MDKSMDYKRAVIRYLKKKHKEINFRVNKACFSLFYYRSATHFIAVYLLMACEEDTP